MGTRWLGMRGPFAPSPTQGVRGVALRTATPSLAWLPVYPGCRSRGDYNRRPGNVRATRPATVACHPAITILAHCVRGKIMASVVAHYRKVITRRDGARCHYCGVRTVEMPTQARNPAQRTIDHKIPRSQGGPTNHRNLVIACLTCNEARGNRDYWEFKRSRALPSTRPPGAH